MRNAHDIFKIFVFKRGEKYEDIYTTLVTEKKIFSNMQELFFLAASIGFKNQKKESFIPKTDMRGEHLSNDSLNIFYTMFINDKNSADNLSDTEELKNYLRKDVVEYAEGGMQILCDEVFFNTWDSKDLSLRKDYDNYAEDILIFIKSQYEKKEF